MKIENMKSLYIFVLIVCASNNTLAAPVTIDFEGVAPPGSLTSPGTPHSEDGFILTNATGTDAIFDSDAFANTNGTDVFGWCGTGNCEVAQVIRLAADGGGDFSLLSFDFAILGGAPPGLQGMEVIGFFGSGGSISETVALDDTWLTMPLFGFTGLSHVEFTDTGGLADLAIDNLVVAPVVPIPAAAWLFGSALLGLVAVKRKKA